MTAEITTRDIDRGDAPHFLLKEIGESPDSFRKTLRGKLVERDGMLHASVGERALPEAVARAAGRRLDPQGHRDRPGNRRHRRAVDGRGARHARRRQPRRRRHHGHRAERVRAAPRHGRHADHRRQPERHDHRHEPHRRPRPFPRGDGARHRQPTQQRPHRQGRRRALHVRRPRRRDERGVDQGVLRAGRGRRAARRRHHRRSGRRRRPPPPRRSSRRCERFPTRCAPCSPRRESIGEAARRFAPFRRYWAVVGSGPNKVAAEEVRIKLSELCYKSIACDVTEDKKHIDLSSEPLDPRVRRGAGRRHGRRRGQGGGDLPGPQGGADRDRHRGRRALQRRPARDRRAGGRPGARLRALGDGRAPVRVRGRAGHRRVGPAAARGARGDRAGGRAGRRRATWCSTSCTTPWPAPARRFNDVLRTGAYDGQMEASTAVRLTSLLRDALSDAPLETYQAESGKVGTPGGARRRPRRRPDPGDRGADPPDRRDQAPGQDRHGRDLAVGRGGARPAPRAGGARRRRRPRPPQLPRAEDPRRPRPRRRRRHGLHPLPRRGRPRRQAGVDRGRRPRRHLASRCRRGSIAIPVSAARSGGWPASASCSSCAAAATGAW